MATKTTPRVRGKTIPIKPSKSARRFAAGCEPTTRPWTRSPAFAVNPRAVLTHRVRHVSTTVWNGEDSHHHVTFLCGNGCNVDLEAIADVLVADPPRDRLLCDFCEAKARRVRLPSGDELAGRHVHRGVLEARRVCCAG